MLEGAEREGVSQGGDQILRGEALAQVKHQTRVVRRRPRLRCLDPLEEPRRRLAEVPECLAELVQVGASARRGAMAGHRHVIAGAREVELVTRDAGEIHGVDDDLGLGHAHREQVGDVLDRNAVAIPPPGNVALAVAHAVDNTGRVVVVDGQRQQVGALLLEELERGALGFLVGTDVAHGGLPVGELCL